MNSHPFSSHLKGNEWEFVKTLDAATPAEVGLFTAQGHAPPPSNCPALRGPKHRGLWASKQQEVGWFKEGPPAALLVLQLLSEPPWLPDNLPFNS